MRPSPSEKPRLVCRVTRAWLSFSGADCGNDSAATRSKHVASCAACQEFFSAADSFEHALKRDAVRDYQPTPDGLERLVMQAVTRSAAAPTRPPRRNTSRYLFLSLAGAAAAAVAVVVSLRQPTTTDREDSTMIADLTQSVENFPDLIRTSIQPSAERFAPKLSSENPLLQEVNSVRDDARSALAFLAANFIPSGLSMPGVSSGALPSADQG